MRVLAVEEAVILFELLGPADIENLVMPTIRDATTDKSWRVRYIVSEKFAEVNYVHSFIYLYILIE